MISSKKSTIFRGFVENFTARISLGCFSFWENTEGLTFYTYFYKINSLKKEIRVNCLSVLQHN